MKVEFYIEQQAGGKITVIAESVDQGKEIILNLIHTVSDISELPGIVLDGDIGFTITFLPPEEKGE